MNICFRFYIKSELCEIDFLKSREISCEVGQPILIIIIFIRMINFDIDQMILWNPGNSKFHVRSVSQAGRKKEEAGNGCQGVEEEGLPSIQEKNTFTDTNICSIKSELNTGNRKHKQRLQVHTNKQRGTILLLRKVGKGNCLFAWNLLKNIQNIFWKHF